MNENFIFKLFTESSIAQAVFIYGLVIALGLAFGSIKLRGVKLGVAGVLFAGILFGHLGVRIHPEILEFSREFGLILFVYSIGMQVGPGFFATLRKSGLGLNLFAASIVAGGVLVTALLILSEWIPAAAAFGIFSGATTNTPSLAAAQQAFREAPGVTAEMLKLPALGYAVSYPFGIVGVILGMIALRKVFKINPAEEAAEYEKLSLAEHPKLEFMDLEVQNPNLHGIALKKVPGLARSSVVVSRILHEGAISIAQPGSIIHTGDILRIVGSRASLEEFRLTVGRESAVDLDSVKSPFTVRRLIVTKRESAGRTLAELDVRKRFGVTVTRITRSEVEFIPSANLVLNLADTLIVVGEENAVGRLAVEMGDTPKELDHPQVIPVFVGIALGILIGSWPISLPGFPVPVKLGLAGGPLLAAIVLSRIGRIGKLIWYMPDSANFMLREVGISLFLACIGLRSGDKFAETLIYGDGLQWMACGALITALPLLAAAVVARVFFRMNYLTLCGLLAGSMTDPPALAYAGQIASSNAPMVSYAAVYPLVMILRVLSAQLLILVFMF